MMIYEIKGNKLYAHSEEEGKYVYISRAIKVVSILEYIDTNELKIELGFLNFFGKKAYIKVLPSQLTRSKFIKFSDNGLDVNEKNIDYILDYINSSINSDKKDYKHIRYHTKLGFYIEDEKIFYKHYNLISPNLDEGNVENNVIVQSQYYGLLDINPHGTFEEFEDFLKNELKDNSPLQLIVSISLTAPFLWMICHLDGDMESMVVHLSGDSSSGKTTALMLAMSLWGNCDSNSNVKSTIRSYNSTANALLKEISEMEYQGVPIAIDELGNSNIKDFTNFVYSISSGSDKKRLTSSSQLMENKAFKTVVLSTGEISMRDNMHSNTIGSQLIRLLELRNVNWTKDAEQSKRIKSFTNKHYGVFAPNFIRFILDNQECIVEQWQFYIDEISEKVISKVGKYGDRLSAKFALILLAHDWFIQFIELEGNSEDILNMLLDSLTDYEDEIDLARKAYDTIMLEFMENQVNYLAYYDSKFRNYVDNNKGNSTNKIYGKYNDKELVILRSRFEKVLEMKGFKNIKVILKKWQDDDIIVSESTSKTRLNPYNRRSLIGKTKVPVVVIKRDNKYENTHNDRDENLEKNAMKIDSSNRMYDNSSLEELSGEDEDIVF